MKHVPSKECLSNWSPLMCMDIYFPSRHIQKGRNRTLNRQIKLLKWDGIVSGTISFEDDTILLSYSLLVD